MTLGAVDPPPFPTRNILGVEISVARQREAIEFLLARLAARLPTQVAFANATLLTELSGRPGGARLLDGFLVLNDGIAVDLASLALYRLWFPENLNGTDLIRRCSQPRLGERGCRSMAPSPEVVAKTAALLEERYGCAVCGAIDGFTVAAPEAVARHLSAGAPTCPRHPLQEEWIATHALTIGAPLTIGVGALFDSWPAPCRAPPSDAAAAARMAVSLGAGAPAPAPADTRSEWRRF
jgi:beta-1,4-glucosyltransferase